MEISQFTIIPADGFFSLNGNTIKGVDMSEMPSDISAVQWENDCGWLEHIKDSETGLKPPNTPIESYEDYMPQLEQAQELLAQQEEEKYAADNPKYFYRTEGRIGEKVTVTSVGWPQPPDTTSEPVPECPSPNVSLYWTGSEFVWLPYPLGATLDEAKTQFCKSVDFKAYSILNKSDWMIVRQTEVGTPVPEDWGDWRQTIREEAHQKKETIEAMTSLDDLAAYVETEEYSTWTDSPA